MEIRLNQVDEMIEHLRLVKRETGTEKSRMAANAIGFFLDTLKTETEKNDPVSIIGDDNPFFLNLTR